MKQTCVVQHRRPHEHSRDSASEKERLFGVTHALNGDPVVRVPRAVKIGIGVPAGKDAEVYIDFDGTWVLRYGEKRNRYATRGEAQKNWPAAVAQAPERKHPRKLDYFTFTKPGAVEYDPDFDAIEHHGPRPREIDVVFIDNDPLQQSFQIWSKSELRCQGDGINAMRSFAYAIATLPDGKGTRRGREGSRSGSRADHQRLLLLQLSDRREERVQAYYAVELSAHEHTEAWLDRLLSLDLVPDGQQPVQQPAPIQDDERQW
jgi:hypothetical protein